MQRVKPGNNRRLISAYAGATPAIGAPAYPPALAGRSDRPVGFEDERALVAWNPSIS
jgi:hypothetical protein